MMTVSTHSWNYVSTRLCHLCHTHETRGPKRRPRPNLFTEKDSWNRVVAVTTFDSFLLAVNRATCNTRIRNRSKQTSRDTVEDYVWSPRCDRQRGRRCFLTIPTFYFTVGKNRQTIASFADVAFYVPDLDRCTEILIQFGTSFEWPVRQPAGKRERRHENSWSPTVGETARKEECCVSWALRCEVNIRVSHAWFCHRRPRHEDPSRGSLALHHNSPRFRALLRQKRWKAASYIGYVRRVRHVAQSAEGTIRNAERARAHLNREFSSECTSRFILALNLFNCVSSSAIARVLSFIRDHMCK